jgi:hypothetical protein
MKTVNLEKEHLDLEGVINLARKEPVLLLTPDGKEFFISEADDFDREVETLRRSPTFQRFLDERSKWDLTSDSSAPQLGPTQSKPKGAQTC